MLRLPAETSDKLSKESYRRQRELAAARKDGKAAPAIDADGNPINPHVPDYISKAPWYADVGNGPGLGHQKQPKAQEKSDMNDWYDRGATAGPAATKYRKGACENCGSMTHKKRDCVERPRRRGAKFTNKDIAPDEVIQSVPRDFDAKRDRWNGYDPSTYKKVVEEYEAAEAMRQKYREEELDKQAAEEKTAKAKAKVKQDNYDEFGSDDDDDEEEDQHAADAADQVEQKVDTKSRMTVRNLRIREDTAKYLINLDPESAYYDPKTRSMRDAPEKGVAPEDLKYAGDNFSRYTGEATNMQRLQLFAWQSAQRGHNVNVHSNPTAGELLHREFQAKREVLKDTSKQSILDRYGGEEHLQRMPEELLGGQTEHYVEYSRTGQIVKGMQKAVARSKYAEDVYTNNHTSVWGSWYNMDSGQWGYACCHSTISGSYCTGEAGKTANAGSSAAALLATEQEAPKSLAEIHRETLAKKAAGKDSDKDEERDDTRDSRSRLATRDEDEDPNLDRARLRKALDAEKKRKQMNDDEAWQQTKKSKTDVTQEEMEAYRLSRQAFEDPMANYKDE